MKRSHLNFQRSKQMGFAGFLVAIAGFFVFVSTPALRAAPVMAPPPWIPFERDAISLYETGINEENSDPASAVKTLRQARQDSTTAIIKGGGSNPAVLHNDGIIGRALMTAQADAAKASENKPEDKPESKGSVEDQKSTGNNRVRPGANHLQVTMRLR